MIVLAIDPGTTESGYAVLEFDGKTATSIVESGKIENFLIFDAIERWKESIKETGLLAIEMIAHYGKNMAAGAETFETCCWIGKFELFANMVCGISGGRIVRVYRHEEKQFLCGTGIAKDKDIIVALRDRYAPGVPNSGKGTKKEPGFFYGVKADAWQAVAVAVTGVEKMGGKL